MKKTTVKDTNVDKIARRVVVSAVICCFTVLLAKNDDICRTFFSHMASITERVFSFFENENSESGNNSPQPEKIISEIITTSAESESESYMTTINAIGNESEKESFSEFVSDPLSEPLTLKNLFHISSSGNIDFDSQYVGEATISFSLVGINDGEKYISLLPYIPSVATSYNSDSDFLYTVNLSTSCDETGELTNLLKLEINSLSPQDKMYKKIAIPSDASVLKIDVKVSRTANYNTVKRILATEFFIE